MPCDLTRKGLVMSIIVHVCRAAAIVALTLAAPVAWSAAPDALPVEEPIPVVTGISAPIDYALETESLPRVLCIARRSRAMAARAKVARKARARKPTCGRPLCGLFRS